MRKSNTLFNQICNFINSQPIGSTFKVQDLNNNVDERSTQWKRSYDDTYYVTRWYAGQLRHCGALAKYQRGTWTVLAHIPDNICSTQIRNYRSMKRWTPNQQQNNNMQNTQPQQEVTTMMTLYKAEGGVVVPESVPVSKMHALLSTGYYFDDKEVAADFAALQKPVKSQLEQEEDDIVERLSGLVLIIGAQSNLPKTIYQFIDGKLYARKVESNYVCANNNVEHESLKRLLQIEAGSALPWTVLAEDILESIENEEYYKEPEKKEEPKYNDMGKFITVEDIRGKEVYIERHTKNNWEKAIIQAFKLECIAGENPKIEDVEVLFVKDDRAAMFDDTTGFCFTKEEVKAKMLASIESL